MPLDRRSVLLGIGSALSLASPALSQSAAEPRLFERGIGSAEAPVRVQEFFSLTCSHCAAFHRETYPRVKRELVEPGQLRMIWRDFPLDGLALAAASVARSLPPERYEGFIGILLNSQDRWAFTRGEPKEELAKIAALAGMARPAFDRAFDDETMKRIILESRMSAEQEFRVQSTPTFAFSRAGGPAKVESGNMAFSAFQRHVEEVRRA